jgi:hypothetical protein
MSSERDAALLHGIYMFFIKLTPAMLSFNQAETTAFSPRFITNEKEAGLLRRHFAGLWALEGEGSKEIIEKAIADPEGFVLKPQREGGGKSTLLLSWEFRRRQLTS